MTPDHHGPDPGDRDQGGECRAGGSESEDAEGHLGQAEEEQAATNRAAPGVPRTLPRS